MDVLTKKQRSFNMSRIKSENTKPEVLIKKFLRDLKIPFKANCSQLPGKPDIFIPSLSLVIQINGCFWHGHKNCRYFVMPSSNVDFWRKKIESNINRDQKNNRELRRSGFKICTIWECEIKNGKFLDKLFRYFRYVQD